MKRAKDLVTADLGNTVQVRGVYATFPSFGEFTVTGTLVSVQHNSKGVTVRFTKSRDVRLAPESIVVHQVTVDGVVQFR